ncbi:MAG TPA: hypothetical protein VFQ01_01660 [Nocardioides sp.]|jgi:hypothetical protein|nr:hypothetical protein [Nocardioides sp.]
MTDLTDVLHRATDDLTPEAPDLLLARAVRRGADLRSRRRATAALTAVVGIAAAVSVTALTLGRPGHATGTHPVTEQPTATATSAAPRPQISIGRHQVGRTFARIIPGEITHEQDSPARKLGMRGYKSMFDWNGYEVGVMITPYSGDADQVCGAGVGQGNGQSCVRIPGGLSVHDVRMDDQNYNRWVSVYLDNGFRMWVLIYNSGEQKGSSSAGPPPLDVPDLEKVATSDLWFE